jgi:hypothetical protein
MTNADAANVDLFESIVLSALMDGVDALPVCADDFASPPNRMIFNRISGMSNRGLLAVTAELRRTKELEKVGGAHRVTGIWELAHDEQTLEYALSNMLEHSRVRQAAKIGEQLNRGNITADEAAARLNSLKTLGRKVEVEVDDFPEPLSELAFHGLAGDIVRRIEPHTEADPVALLIQVLIAFGNVIDRFAHAMADGSRHAMNLFCVLVGKSSKARKGTSWSHVRRLFNRVDEEWAQNCIVNGLSSGEGVIWAVRDQISRTVKGKREIVDAGVKDKRLCVVEGEFANVLRVMGREGNTLSPVIRSAWDSGNLRSITKNAPARATDAHISILGHITRDELRRLLTETESANGFGNRFLWLAVRRSKCLPEGGNLDDDNLNDLVLQIHEAIEFARMAGLVRRDDDARKLWRRDLPATQRRHAGTSRSDHSTSRGAGAKAERDLRTVGSLDKGRPGTSQSGIGLVGLQRPERQMDFRDRYGEPRCGPHNVSIASSRTRRIKPHRHQLRPIPAEHQ